MVYNSSSINEIKNHSNSFLDFDLIKYIPFANFFLKDIKIFLSSYIVYVYPPKSKNIYISHDIYDTPMVNKNLERKIARINKLDYIFYHQKFLLIILNLNLKNLKYDIIQN